MIKQISMLDRLKMHDMDKNGCIERISKNLICPCEMCERFDLAYDAIEDSGSNTIKTFRNMPGIKNEEAKYWVEIFDDIGW